MMLFQQKSIIYPDFSLKTMIPRFFPEFSSFSKKKKNDSVLTKITKPKKILRTFPTILLYTERKFSFWLQDKNSVRFVPGREGSRKSVPKKFRPAAIIFFINRHATFFQLFSKFFTDSLISRFFLAPERPRLRTPRKRDNFRHCQTQHATKMCGLNCQRFPTDAQIFKNIFSQKEKGNSSYKIFRTPRQLILRGSVLKDLEEEKKSSDPKLLCTKTQQTDGVKSLDIFPSIFVSEDKRIQVTR